MYYANGTEKNYKSFLSMSFESNKKINFDIFYCGKTIKSFSRKITVFKSDTVEKSGKIWTTWEDILLNTLTNCFMFLG